MAEAPDEVSPSVGDLLALAKRLSIVRDRRPHFFPHQLFGEPAWDMLIALFCAETEGQVTTVTNLCNEGRAPATTALRWIESLIELELVCRRRNPLDARVIFIELEPNGRDALHEYLCQIWATLYGPP